MADSVSISPRIRMETDTLLFLSASSFCSAPKKPFIANLVAVYGATNGLASLPESQTKRTKRILSSSSRKIPFRLILIECAPAKLKTHLPLKTLQWWIHQMFPEQEELLWPFARNSQNSPATSERSVWKENEEIHILQHCSNKILCLTCMSDLTWSESPFQSSTLVFPTWFNTRKSSPPAGQCVQQSLE